MTSQSPRASQENAAPASAARKSPPHPDDLSSTAAHPAASACAPKTSNSPRPSTSDPCPENACQYLPTRPLPTTHRKARGTTHLHPSAPPNPYQTALPRRQSSAFAPQPAGADRNQFPSESFVFLRSQHS